MKTLGDIGGYCVHEGSIYCIRKEGLERWMRIGNVMILLRWITTMRLWLGTIDNYTIFCEGDVLGVHQPGNFYVTFIDRATGEELDKEVHVWKDNGDEYEPVKIDLVRNLECGLVITVESRNPAELGPVSAGEEHFHEGSGTDPLRMVLIEPRFYDSEDLSEYFREILAPVEGS